MKCPNSVCSKDIPDDAMFCPYCEAKVTASDAEPKTTPVQKNSETEETMIFVPSAEPFFKKWIADHKDWAKENGIIWISKFYGNFAVAVKKFGRNNHPLSYALIEGEQDPKWITILEGALVNMRKNITKKNGVFENASQYFAYDFCLTKRNLAVRGLINDDNFLKVFEAFGDKNFDKNNIAEYQHFCGVYHYDGTRLFEHATAVNASTPNFVHHTTYDYIIPYYPHYVALGNYIAVYNNKGEIPEKNFYPYNIIDPIKGETIVSNVMLPYEGSNNYGIFESVFDEIDCLFFIPYNDSITMYCALFDDHLQDIHSEEGELIKPHLKVFFTKTGRISPCIGNNYYRRWEVLGNPVLLMYDPNSNPYLINQFGCVLEFNTAFSGDRRVWLDYTGNSWNEICWMVCSSKLDKKTEEFECKIYRLISFNSTEPKVEFINEIITKNSDFDFIEYGRKEYALYANNSGLYVVDENFKQIDMIEQVFDIKNAILKVGQGDNNDILYLMYKTKDGIRTYIKVKDLNGNKIVLSIPEPPRFDLHDYSVRKFNGILFLANDDADNDVVHICDIICQNGTYLPLYDDWRVDFSIQDKCKNLPESMMILKQTTMAENPQYLIVDLVTGEDEGFENHTTLINKLKQKYGYK